ncbi:MULTISPECIES: hypothetical protein [unclassified Streptomyces]|nr:hypothetical protein [Streptomyces sp. NBC_01439]
MRPPTCSETPTAAQITGMLSADASAGAVRDREHTGHGRYIATSER